MPRGGQPVAFDTGPHNDSSTPRSTKPTAGRLAHDDGGALASARRVHEPLLLGLLDAPYCRRPAPRTTGKESFHRGYLRAVPAGFGGLPAEYAVATVTRLFARTVADAVRPPGATEVVASGGGTRNPVLTAMLRDGPAGVAPRTSDEPVLPSPEKETIALAVLGHLTPHGLPGNAPECTGARGADPRLDHIGKPPLRQPRTPARAPGSPEVGARHDTRPPSGERRARSRQPSRGNRVRALARAAGGWKACGAQTVAAHRRVEARRVEAP
ncbi:anhydro-N-acetylmuramic acid kinase [Streptomyces sp. WMMC940]|nr:anhydro-N-acetylmuramic acid kinase [Streptomyces sp. WMMC940]MCZ7456508.1 anhydro-N-acetylmuramic acid kinase [Streptomyces sp. WMMC940]